MLVQMFFCPRCGTKYRMKAEYVRPEVECPKCRLEFRAPGNPVLKFANDLGEASRRFERN